ncbi:unnamed protein product [Lepeophtheirus salmonis]|uniref:tRNA (34-2'-O)-methyltransferase regulator WDR6 n=1 Tax=Lepeophtheirus salmonis TaxID=72036 RepID=A0A7R8CC93_LEPSM|nr:unnamed protein product [Lepeophtheirus salmonis]CAF2763730.1 unnamed protein product [Lepeophtheirus salmonis]
MKRSDRLGRDGTMRIFIVKDDDLIPLKCDKAQLFMDGENLYDPEHEKIIYQVPCGGCHRSWDFRFDHESFGVFTYVKDKVVHQVVLLNILNEMVIKPIFHTKEINALKVVAFENSQYLLTGGEDTKLLLRNLKNNRITSNLKSHISNIRCLDAILDGDSMILASGGGRAELKLWRMFPDQNIILLSSFLMKGNDKRRKKVWRDTKLIPDVETRITSVTLWKKNDSLTFIVIACSDGLLRLLQYDANFSKLQIIKESAEGPSLSGSTKGDLQVWKIEDDYSFRAISQVIAHQSGINAIDILGHFIVTGGINDAHESQITGVKYMDQFILSCGVDQKFITWRSSDFSFYSQEISSVADVKGIEVFKDKVIIVGEGVQEPAPWTISEANNHCVHAFEKLRIQREQGRFCDVTLSIQGRTFPAHRCVLASCSPWFDTNLKVYKTTKETVEVTQCKNYEIFHQLLTYCYTGQIIVDKNNVPELLHLSNYYAIFKLKSYCSEYLERNLNSRNCVFVFRNGSKILSL